SPPSGWPRAVSGWCTRPSTSTAASASTSTIRSTATSGGPRCSSCWSVARPGRYCDWDARCPRQGRAARRVRFSDYKQGSPVTTRRHHAIAVLLTFAPVLASAACTRSDSETETGGGGDAASETSDGGGGGSSGGALSDGNFGDLEHVCGEAEEGADMAAEETGLTADQIRLGTITDKGSQERP